MLPTNSGTNIYNNDCQRNNNWNGYQCPGTTYSVIRFKSTAWDARKMMNLPVGLKGPDGFLNEMNMMWEWDWLPDGDPADHRLQ